MHPKWRQNGLRRNILNIRAIQRQHYAVNIEHITSLTWVGLFVVFQLEKVNRLWEPRITSLSWPEDHT